jgi:type IV pilus assembly protein PilQ
LQSVSISGTGSEYQLDVVPAPGLPIGRPVVSADGRNLLISFPAPSAMPQQTASLDLRAPGSIPQPSFAPPLQPRAVAPPLGDMAVGSMVLRNQGFVNLRGPRVTLNLRKAKALDALLLLTRMGNYGFVFVDDRANSVTTAVKALSLALVRVRFNQVTSKSVHRKIPELMSQIRLVLIQSQKACL